VTEPESILQFWFGAIAGGFATATQRKRWFQPSAEFDDAIRHRFATLLDRAAAEQLNDWRITPRGALALIVLTDQFSRQIHRGRTEAFATDPVALSTARAGVAEAQDRALEFDERAFFYLPFEHSESMADQDQSVRLFTRLRDDTPSGLRHLTGDYLRHAKDHRDIIRRFGRFPHRNAALGRTSTPEEQAYLADAGRFGQ
jgi:uncharacterized protein (DUF924 family)